MSSLDEFLAAEMSEGVKDSSGQFTLAPEKAIEKLAAFQLPGESSWVGKVIQAAVTAGFSELKL